MKPTKQDKQDIFVFIRAMQKIVGNDKCFNCCNSDCEECQFFQIEEALDDFEYRIIKILKDE